MRRRNIVDNESIACDIEGEKLSDVIDILQVRLEEYKGNPLVEDDPTLNIEWGDYTGYIHLTSYREETDEEMLAREIKIEEERKKEIAKKEKEEFQLYMRLQEDQ